MSVNYGIIIYYLLTISHKILIVFKQNISKLYFIITYQTLNYVKICSYFDLF